MQRESLYPHRHFPLIYAHAHLIKTQSRTGTCSRAPALSQRRSRRFSTVLLSFQFVHGPVDTLREFYLSIFYVSDQFYHPERNEFFFDEP